MRYIVTLCITRTPVRMLQQDELNDAKNLTLKATEGEFPTRRSRPPTGLIEGNPAKRCYCSTRE